MEPDPYQQAWRAESSQTRITIDVDLLRKEVQRSHRNFRAMIFWRDVREVGVAVVLLLVWVFLGPTLKLPWTWYLTIPALIWVMGFLLVDRLRHKPKRGAEGETLLESVTESLRQVEHQIWLLRNIVWWYLLPFTISILAFFAQASSDALVPTGIGWLTLVQAGLGLIFFGLLCAILFAVYGWVYSVNQKAVQTELEPRRQELLALLKSLGNEPVTEARDE